MTDNSDNSILFTTPVQGVLPDLCEIRNLFVSILLTIILSIVFSLLAIQETANFWSLFSMISMVMLWIALIDIALICQIRRYLNRLSIKASLSWTYFLLMVVSLVVSISVLFINQLVPEEYLIFSAETESIFVTRVLFISAVIYFVILRYLYIQYQWRMQVIAQSEAKVESLRARIRPHFLFNSMNTIASLIEIDPEKAEKAVEDLSDLFRASLGNKNLSPLSEEVALVKSYLDIEKLRLGDRLQVSWNTDESMLETPVPSLCLQPLVENAIYHGIEPIKKGGKIQINLLNIEGKLELSVSNPLSTENLVPRKQGNQIAQDNIKQRLNLVYGSSAEFSINDTKELYTVTLKIPLGVNDERSNCR